MRNVYTLTLLIFALWLPGCGSSTEHVQERRDYWDTALSQLLPGSKKDAIYAWAQKHSIELAYLPKQHWYYAVVETIPAKGIPFPCSEWVITVTIETDAKEVVKSTKSGAVGKCV